MPRATEKIGSLLETLGENHLVIHDIESPYGNIDHIVISNQSDVFLLETKAHGGKVSVSNGQLLVNGHDPEKDFIAQALNSTYWLRDKIHPMVNADVWVTPILVFTKAFVERTAPIKGMTIINKKFLLNLLQKPKSNPKNLVIWENREKIMNSLFSKADGSVK